MIWNLDNQQENRESTTAYRIMGLTTLEAYGKNCTEGTEVFSQSKPD